MCIAPSLSLSACTSEQASNRLNARGVRDENSGDCHLVGFSCAHGSGFPLLFVFFFVVDVCLNKTQKKREITAEAILYEQKS